MLVRVWTSVQYVPLLCLLSLGAAACGETASAPLSSTNAGRPDEMAAPTAASIRFDIYLRVQAPEGLESAHVVPYAAREQPFARCLLEITEADVVERFDCEACVVAFTLTPRAIAIPDSRLSEWCPPREPYRDALLGRSFHFGHQRDDGPGVEEGLGWLLESAWPESDARSAWGRLDNVSSFSHLTDGRVWRFGAAWYHLEE